MKKKYPEILLFIAAIIWGGGFSTTKTAIQAGISPYWLMTMRFLLATILLLIFFYKNIYTNFRSHYKHGVILGLFLFLGFAFQTYGIKYTTPSNNAFLTSTGVIMVPFVSWATTKKLPDKLTFIGAALTMIGIGFLTLDESLTANIGDILSIACAFFFALHLNFIGIFSKDKDNKIDSLTIVFIQMLVVSVLSYIFAVSYETYNVNFDLKSVGAVLYLGIFSTLIGFFIQNYAQKYVSETKAAIILSTEAVFGLIFSVIIINEVLTLRMLTGAFIIFIAIIITETRLDFFKMYKNKRVTR